MYRHVNNQARDAITPPVLEITLMTMLASATE